PRQGASIRECRLTNYASYTALQLKKAGCSEGFCSKAVHPTRRGREGVQCLRFRGPEENLGKMQTEGARQCSIHNQVVEEIELTGGTFVRLPALRPLSGRWRQAWEAC